MKFYLVDKLDIYKICTIKYSLFYIRVIALIYLHEIVY